MNEALLASLAVRVSFFGFGIPLLPFFNKRVILPEVYLSRGFNFFCLPFPLLDLTLQTD